MLLLWGAGACATPSSDLRAALAEGRVQAALEAYQASGREAGLRDIATEVLVQEARSQKPKQRARSLAALRTSGTHARPALSRLAQDRDPELRAQALALLTALGDAAALRELEALSAGAEPRVQAAVVASLDSAKPAERERLREALRTPFVVVRLAALGALRGATADAGLLMELSRVAAADPEASARAAAVARLADTRRGENTDTDAPLDVAQVLEARLQDPEEQVRVAAFAALVGADPARAERIFLRDLSGDLSVEAIAAARALASREQGHAGAILVLVRALHSSDAGHRARAATTASGMSNRRVRAAAAQQLEREPVRGTRLALALLLQPELGARRRELIALALERDVVGTQAVAELARAGDAKAVQSLVSRLAAESASVRSIAARTLARDLRMPSRVYRLLADSDPAVRVSAAAAILAGQ